MSLLCLGSVLYYSKRTWHRHLRNMCCSAQAGHEQGELVPIWMVINLKGALGVRNNGTDISRIAELLRASGVLGYIPEECGWKRLASKSTIYKRG